MRSVNVLLLLMLSFHEVKSACKYIFIGYHYFRKSKGGTVG